MRRLSAKWIAVFRAYDQVRHEAEMLQEGETRGITNGLLILLGISALGFITFLVIKLR